MSEMIERLADLFDTVRPETPEEIDDALRGAGFDPERVAIEMREIARRVQNEREEEEGEKRTPLLLKMPLRRALEAAADARAMTMSAWIREAIQEKLEREEAESGQFGDYDA